MSSDVNVVEWLKRIRQLAKVFKKLESGVCSTTFPCAKQPSCSQEQEVQLTADKNITRPDPD